MINMDKFGIFYICRPSQIFGLNDSRTIPGSTGLSNGCNGVILTLNVEDYVIIGIKPRTVKLIFVGFSALLIKKFALE